MFVKVIHTILTFFRMGTRVHFFVIYLLPLSARVKRQFFQSVDRPGVDPKTARVLIDPN
jgi:hypothetical protein